MASNPSPLKSREKIKLLESNGFKQGDISYPHDFTRIRSLDNFFHIKSSIPYHVVMTVNIEDLKKIIARIDENNDYELASMKFDYKKGMGKSAF